MRRQAALTVAVVVLALGPYAGLPFSFETGMYAQVAVVLGVLGTLAATAGRGALDRLKALPRPVRLGLALYVGAALWGTAVGIIAGNPFRFLVGQTISMLVLPAAAVAFSLHRERLGGDELARALAVAALIIAFAVAATSWPNGASLPWPRLELSHNISFSSTAVLVVIVTLTLLLFSPSLLVVAGALAAVFLLIEGLSRGAWAGASVGCLLSASLASFPDRRRALLALAGGIGLAAALTTVVLWGASAGTVIVATSDIPAATTDRPVVTGVDSPPSPPSEVHLKGGRKSVPLITKLPVRGCGLSSRFTVTGPPGSPARFAIVAKDDDGTKLLEVFMAVTGSGAPEMCETVVRLPRGAKTVGVSVSGQAASWQVTELRLVSLASSIETSAAIVHSRVRSALDLAAGRTIPPTVRYRLRETQAVRDDWARGGLWRRIAGAGLGARFAFENSGWDSGWRRVTLPEASYIHNFFLFLAYKLGVGGVAALWGLLLVMGSNVGGALKSRGRSRWVQAAAAGCWAAYLVWGISSPEIIDFRLAPLLGALIAAAAVGPESEVSGVRRPRDAAGAREAVDVQEPVDE